MKPFDLLSQNLETGVFLIEASAGTGKTYHIQHLYLRLIAERGLPVKEILVVTYTEAATAELRDRIRKNLRSALDVCAGSVSDLNIESILNQARRSGVGEGKLRERLIKALNAFDEAAVMTLHGFCKRTLQEEAFESNSPFDVEFVTSQELFVAEAVRDFWRREREVLGAEGVLELFDGEVKNPVPAWTRLGMKVLDNPALRIVEPCAEASAMEWLNWKLCRWLKEDDPVGKRKTALGKLTFSDMIAGLYNALVLNGDSSRLTASVRKRFKAALIDEFQDTDPAQYAIFKTLFAVQGHLLMMIGDPKQSIYAFRGADVQTYLNAKNDADAAMTLSQNFRSDSRLLQAVETLFDRPEPFACPGIDYETVTAGRADFPELLIRGEVCRSPMRFRWIAGADDTPVNKGVVRNALPSDICEQVLTLLQQGVFRYPDGSERAVRPSDIAILASSHAEIETFRTVLREAAVPSVSAKSGNVYASATAGELAQFMQSLCETHRTDRLRAALTTTLVGLTDEWLLKASEDPADPLAVWIETFRTWRKNWERAGTMAFFSAVFHDRTPFGDGRSMFERLAFHPDGERRIADLRHLLFLLHEEEGRGALSPERLTNFLCGRIAEVSEGESPESSDEERVRLETDAEAVTLMTVHASKGLEYPICLCPSLWSRAADVRGLFTWHDDEGVVLGLDGVSQRDGKPLALREQLSEALRLTYVAVTRAKNHLILWGGAVQNGNTRDSKDPLTYLLAKRQSRDFPDAETFLAQGAKVLCPCEPPELPGIQVEKWIPEKSAVLSSYSPAVPQRLSFKDLPNDFSVPVQWGVMSYTALGNAVSGGVWEREEKFESAALEPPLLSGVSREKSSLFGESFPRGRLSGIAVHAVMEAMRTDWLSESGHISEAARERISDILEHHGLDGKDERIVSGCSEMVSAVLTEPFQPSDSEPFTLCGNAVRSIPEMGFYYGIPGDVDFSALAALCGTAVDSARYGLRRGVMTGAIDLVVRHGERYYFVDYKSDTLGDGSLSAYSEKGIQEVMIPSHYRLQSLIYALALHLYLQERIPNYHFETHFGGGFYLFLRGIAKDSPGGRIHLKLAWEEISEMARILGLGEVLG